MQYTSQAWNQLQTIFIENPHNKYFRVAILGGGCSGFQYEFALIESKENDDIFFAFPKESTCQGLIIDPISYEYLEKAILDYQRDLSGARFLIRNPKEQRVCGCGLSVSFD